MRSLQRGWTICTGPGLDLSAGRQEVPREKAFSVRRSTTRRAAHRAERLENLPDDSNAHKQLFNLRLRQRRRNELGVYGTCHNRIEPGDFGWVEGRLRIKFIASAFGDSLRHRGDRSIEFDRLVAAIHPVDRLAIGIEKALQHLRLFLDKLQTCDRNAHRLTAQVWQIVSSRDQTDLALVKRFESEGRQRPADINLL